MDLKIEDYQKKARMSQLFRIPLHQMDGHSILICPVFQGEYNLNNDNTGHYRKHYYNWIQM